MPRVLLLAGTAEARALAAALAARTDLSAIASLAGATQAPAPLALPTRTGGFGGAEGFVAFLRAERIGAVVDATHPFAARISARSAMLCRELAVPYLQLLRPEWTPQPGDRWHIIAREEEAADIIPPEARVFLATGPAQIDRFAGLSGRQVICRRIDASPEPFPWPQGRYVQGRPPFTVADEEALLRRFRVDWLVTRNAGGASGRSKLEAARRLGLPVAMIARPAQPDAPQVGNPAAALDWIERRIWTNASF
ncbi:MAG: cobalt-precorrin-6A reductase [Rhodobacteraceae bacterium]|nr:cobalt-precorrin-6A reductase [Paracoccaceae bacterium]